MRTTQTVSVALRLLGVLMAIQLIQVPCVSSLASDLQDEAPKTPRTTLLPTLTGPYRTGTRSFHIVDPSREELHTPEDAQDKREFMVQVWYPAKTNPAETPVAWLPDSSPFLEQAKKDMRDIPQAFWERCRTLRSHSIPNAPILPSEGRFPVLLYSHGWNLTRVDNLYLVEELASHGYVVIGFDHTYNCKVLRFPDGRIISHRPSQSVGGREPWEIHVQDIQFVLDLLTSVKSTHPFARAFVDSLELSRIGGLGFSYGGVNFFQTAEVDPRIKAVVSLDGPWGPDLKQPQLIVESEFKARTYGLRNAAFTGEAFLCELSESTHLDFSVFPLIWKTLGIDGKWPPDSKLDPRLVQRTIADCCLWFFDQHLKADPGSSPLDASLKLPQGVTFERLRQR
jgi:predicted dienelactone hydrolase